MIITNDFVMLNFPKTGGSFARYIIKRVYRSRRSFFRRVLEKLGLLRPLIIDLRLPKLDEAEHHHVAEEQSEFLRAARNDQHGTWRQIPSQYLNRPVVSITRNPFSRYVSDYLFRYWENYPPARLPEIVQLFPGFPGLSFIEYYEMMHVLGTQNRLGGIVPKIELGLSTIQFIQFYFKDPEAVLGKIDESYIDNDLFLNDLAKVEFVHQETLNRELKSFLVRMGFLQSELGVIDSQERINVTVAENGPVDYHTFYRGTDLELKILQRDRLLFKIFPEYSYREVVDGSSVPGKYLLVNESH